MQTMICLRVVELTRQRSLMPSLADCRIVQARGGKRQGAIAGIIHHLTHSMAPALAETDAARWGGEPWGVFGAAEAD